MSISTLKERMKESGSAALIMSEENVRYYTGFSSSNGYLLVTGQAAYFLTDSRYIEAAEKTIKTCDEICEFKSIEKTLAPLVCNLAIKSICIEQSRLTIAKLRTLEKNMPQVSFVTDNTLDGVITLERSVKTALEVEKTKKAQAVAKLAFEHILGFIKPGVCEKEIALELDYTMLKNGADALSFETIAVSGANGSMPHGVPGSKRVENGDFVTMDFGAVFDGYHSDMTRTVAVGAVSSEQEKVYNIVFQAQKAGLEKIKNGVCAKEVDEKARNVIKSNGYGEFFGHGFGHGVGIEIHEYPNESPSSTAVLQSGNIVTAEPGIYIPGKFGVRIEDMVLVTDDGYYNFTNCKKELIVL